MVKICLQLAIFYQNKFFVATADAGSKPPGKPHEMKYTNDHGNACVCLVEHPDIISKFFHDYNTIDKN
jgi:hypothetical protein